MNRTIAFQGERPRSRQAPPLRLLAACLLLLMTPIGPTAALATGSVPSSSGTCGWSIVKSPAGNARLFTVDAIATDDAWEAGHGAKGGPAVLIEHWDGSQWTKATVPSIPTPAGINDLTAVSGSNVWAVGWQAITGGSVPVRTLAEHWDGAAWKIVPTVDPAGARSNSLVSVSARSANDIWAVGYSLIGFSHQTLIEHWDGTTWSVVPSPNPGTYDVLLGVDAISSSDAWAVGYRDDGFGAATLVEHWDGMSWNVVQIHNAGTVQNVLADVTMVSSSNVWAVGYKSNGGNYRTLVEHWNGTSWRAIDSPNVGSSNMLLDVAFDSPADGWAVGGSYIRGGDDGYNGLIEHWDGTSWSVSTSPNSKATSDRLTAVAVVPSSGGMAWAVGSTQKAGLTEQYCGPGGSPMPSRDSSVRAAPSAVVGSSGRVDRSVARPDARTSVQTSSAQSVIAVDEADSAGIAQTTYTYGAAVDDYNNDGWPDFVYDRHFDPAGVYMNNKDGTFTQTAQFTGIWERLGCTSGDVNQDGLADVFCAIGNDWGTDLHGSELWIQQPDHSFIDQGGAYGVLDPTGRDRRGVFIDANHDGYPDLWLGTKAERPDGLPSPDRLLINVGGTKFVDAPQYGLDQEVSGGICGQAFDYNNDGYQDLMTCTDAGLFVYRNDGGQQF